MHAATQCNVVIQGESIMSSYEVPLHINDPLAKKWVYTVSVGMPTCAASRS